MIRNRIYSETAIKLIESTGISAKGYSFKDNTYHIKNQIAKYNSDSVPMLPQSLFISALLESYIKGVCDKNFFKLKGFNQLNNKANPEEVKLSVTEAYNNLGSISDGNRLDTIKQITDRITLDTNDLGRINGYQWRNYGGDFTCISGNRNTERHIQTKITYEAPDGTWMGLQFRHGVDQLYVSIHSIKERSTYSTVIYNVNPVDLSTMAFVTPVSGFFFGIVDETLNTHIFINNCDILSYLDEVLLYSILNYVVAMELGIRKGSLYVSSGNVYVKEPNIKELENISNYNVSYKKPEGLTESTLFSFDYKNVVCSKNQ